MRVDVLFKNARIVDGAGTPWFRGDIAVADGRILFPGQFASGVTAVREIDVADRYLMPGFIDSHTHMDFVLLRDPQALPRLRQGVTTQVIGQCGFSAAPVGDAGPDLLETFLAFLAAGVKPRWQWRTFGQWLDTLAALPLGANVASNVGHGTLRLAVMGMDDRPARPEELTAMKDLLRRSLAEGARGMTSGLIYPPGSFAPAAELMELAGVLREHGAFYESHMRNESDRVIECVAETIAVAERTGAAVIISHHKASGRRNFGKSVESLRLIDDARGRGLDVTLNQHSYEVGSTTLRAILPGWAQEGGFEALAARLTAPETRARIRAEVEAEHGDWDNYYRNSGGAAGVIPLNTPRTPDMEGRPLSQLAAERGMHPLELAFDLILANQGDDTAAFDNIGLEDIERILRHPATILASDAIPGPPGAKVHPRLCGANVRILDLFVRQRKTLSLEEAVRKMTSAPARRLRFHDRGFIAPGMAADLVIVDMDRVRDNTSFANPSAAPDGIDLVMVNGRVAMENGEATAARAGLVLR